MSPWFLENFIGPFLKWALIINLSLLGLFLLAVLLA